MSHPADLPSDVADAPADFPVDALFQPLQLGPITLANRIVMAPLTRSRAEAGNVPGEMTITYYAQRAGVGLIIAEATQVSADAQGYAATPGLHTPAQIAGWRRVTDAVHARGGRIFVQLWHTGRMSHTAYQPDGRAPLAPSAIAAKAKTWVAGEGYVPTSTPREASVAEIARIVGDFAQAAKNAIAAGFDGVEIHAAHGYLIDAFLRNGTNHRNDAYGGAIEHRARFLLEVTDAVIAAIGKERTGLRLAPVSPVNDAVDSDPTPLFTHVVRELEKRHPVYLHIVEGHTGGPRDNVAFDYAALRRLYSGVWLVNNGYDREMAARAVADGRADLVSFGRLMITNPDLPRRFRAGAPLNEPFADASLYGGSGPHGYIDYPAMD